MIVCYRCPSCGRVIGRVSVDHLDEEKFGLDILTPSEKEAIINIVSLDLVEIQTRCEDCLP